MVGVPRSKGCRICVQRRVRCDLTKPVCNNCKKGNRPCPGFDSDLRIQDEGSKLRKRFAQPHANETRIESYTDSTSTTNTSQSTDSSPEKLIELVTRGNTPDDKLRRYRPEVALPPRNPFFLMLENQVQIKTESFLVNASESDYILPLSGGAINLDYSFFQVALNGSVYSPNLAQEQLLSTFSSALAGHGASLLPPQMRVHQKFVEYLPSFFGSNKLLDAAVRAVSLVHLGRSQQSEVLIQESRQYYGKALCLLNRSLTDDNDGGMATETLSATILLSFYEMFASDSNQSWVRHAGGAGTLMRIRGPSRHLKGVDRDIFLAYRHTVIIDAFIRDEACFLAEPQWVEMANKIHEDLRTGIPNDRLAIFDLSHEFYLEHAVIPTLLRDVKNMDHAQAKMTPEQYGAHREVILARARLHQANLKSINFRFCAALTKEGLETSTIETMDPVFPEQYVYINVFVASVQIGHWTIMLILNLFQEDLEKDIAPEKTALYLMENRALCQEICQTTPFMLTSSFLGPFFVIFALRLCLMIFEQGEERDWVVHKLVQIGDTRMRMALDIPRFTPDQHSSEI